MEGKGEEKGVEGKQTTADNNLTGVKGEEKREEKGEVEEERKVEWRERGRRKEKRGGPRREGEKGRR